MEPPEGTQEDKKAQMQRRDSRASRLSKIQARQQAGARADINWRMRKRSRRITLCLLSLISAICCLSPFTSIQLTQRVGMLLFESDLIQLRSSFVCVIICFTTLVIFNFVVHFLSLRASSSAQKIRRLQSILSKTLSLSAIISAISYLSIILLVPQIRQIQRMPIASFDCNANLITIENCEQQFTTQNGEQTLDEAIKELLIGDLKSNNDRLIEKLNCLKFNNRELDTLEVPTRFVLHNCGLVCRPHRQQVHQFSDDLNKDQNPRPLPEETLEVTRTSALESDAGDAHVLVPPYDRSPGADTSHVDQRQSQVSMKVCFSGEFDSGSNYKQFCITNLASGRSGHQSQELTIGQLNAMLQSIMMPGKQQSSVSDNPFDANGKRKSQPLVSNENTLQYVNPVVQFESHFKNWPSLPTVINTAGHSPPYEGLYEASNSPGNAENWCKFRPIPPFVVNNKPFSDIQCSLEHEYTMTTGPILDATRFSGRGADRIYLKKSSMELGSTESLARERCNIQCKVNILYQVRTKSQGSKQSQDKTANSELHSSSTNYYLPLKPCVIVAGEGDKLRTSSYYLMFRSVADASLFIAFILVDCILLLESIGSKKFSFEGNNFRLLGILVVVILVPVFVALTFDLTADWSPIAVQSNKSPRDSYLVDLVKHKIIPKLTEIFSGQTPGNAKLKEAGRQQSDSKVNSSDSPQIVVSQNVDNYMAPFFFYAFFMFILAVCSLTLPSTSLDAPLIRVSSVEQLAIDKDEENQAQNKDSEPETSNRQQTASKPQSYKVAMFANMVLFMGLQFNLSQFIQTQVFIETFGNPGIAAGQVYAGLWYIVGTHSSPLVLILIMISPFLDEASALLASFSPFDSSAFMEDSESGPRRNRIKLLKCLSASLLIYAMRYYFMTRLNPLSPFKWPIVILIQIAEFLNFPLTWFALSARAHEIFMEHPIYQKCRKSKNDSASNTRALDVHLTIQTALAFVFFIGARFVALFIHSIHASLHLHSDNVDWFITNFRHQPSTTGAAKLNGSFSIESPSVTPAQSQQQASNPAKTDSLFSPLPDERQTYMYASRLFFMYNSVLCLLIGISVLISLLHLKYKIWVENKRVLKAAKLRMAEEKAQDSDSDINQRLRADLMRMRASSSNTKTIYPRTGERVIDPSCDPQSGPRAKILFHYNLDRGDSSDDDASGQTAPELDRSAETTRPLREPSRQIQSGTTTSSETVIPIAVADEDSDGGEVGDDEYEADGHQFMRRPTEERVERIVRHRNKRVRIFEDGDDWSKVGEKMSNEDVQSDEKQAPRSKRRTISFAPTAILIDNDKAYSSNSSERYRAEQASRKLAPPPRRASPEPSIGEENMNDSIDEGNNSIENSR